MSKPARVYIIFAWNQVAAVFYSATRAEAHKKKLMETNSQITMKIYEVDDGQL